MSENHPRALISLTRTIPDLAASGTLSHRTRFLVFSDPSNPSRRAEETIVCLRNKSYYAEFARVKRKGHGGHIAKQAPAPNCGRSRSLPFLALQERPFACEPIAFGSCHSSAHIVVSPGSADDSEDSWIHLIHCTLQSIPGSQDVTLHTLGNDSIRAEQIGLTSALRRDEIASQAELSRDDVLGSTWRLSLTDNLVFILHILPRPMGFLGATNPLLQEFRRRPALAPRILSHTHTPCTRSSTDLKSHSAKLGSASNSRQQPLKARESRITSPISAGEAKAKPSDALENSPTSTIYDPVLPATAELEHTYKKTTHIVVARYRQGDSCFVAKECTANRYCKDCNSDGGRHLEWRLEEITNEYKSLVDCRHVSLACTYAHHLLNQKQEFVINLIPQTFSGYGFCTEHLGRDLSTYRNNSTGYCVMTAAEALQVLFQISSALAHIHDLDIIHHDLKPQNILWDGKGRAALCDFGLAGKSARRTNAGSHHYIALDFLFDDLRGPEYDVWALGVTALYLFGHLPCPGYGEGSVYKESWRISDISQSRTRETPDSLSAVTKFTEWQAVIMTAKQSMRKIDLHVEVVRRMLAASGERGTASELRDMLSKLMGKNCRRKLKT